MMDGENLKPFWHLAFVIGLAGCTARAKPSIPWAGCYVVAWPDSQEAGRLPDSLRLEPVQDTAMKPPFPTMFFARPIIPTSQARWADLAGTWWTPSGTDSFELTMTTKDLEWDVTFILQRDSLRGRGIWAVGDALEPFTVTGWRVKCP